MCLAILKTAGAIIPDDHLKEGWISNPDGGGYGFVDKGKIVVRKGFPKWKEFAEAYDKDSKQYTETPFLVHFRICTMGTKGVDNTHPFEIEDGILIHNGTISGTGAKYGEGKSDTAIFAETFSKDLSFDFVHANKQDLGRSLDYNKIAILYKDKRFSIINESDGHWLNGVWYSNYGYSKRGYSPYYGGMYGDD